MMNEFVCVIAIPALVCSKGVLLFTFSPLYTCPSAMETISGLCLWLFVIMMTWFHCTSWFTSGDFH